MVQGIYKVIPKLIMKKAVVLLSGGLDSTTCLAHAIKEGFACFALSFDYGQKNIAELNAARKIAQTLGAKKHEIITLSIGNLGGSALTDKSVEVPNYTEKNEIPITYVPARNTTFLSIALGWAEILEAEAIFIGASSVDYSGYPDCRPEYFAAFQTVAKLATKMGLDGKTVNIVTPLINLSKAETIQLGQSLGVDYSQTVTCYKATSEGLACGKCDSCHFRKKGFEEAKIPDPTRYQQALCY